MNERVMQFRIGMFVIVAGLVLTMLIVWFGEMPSLFRDHVFVKVRYPDAPGVSEGIPVRKSGIRVGEVFSIEMDERDGQPDSVVVILSLERKYKVRKDSVARLSRSLIGDVAVDLSPGNSREIVEAGTSPTTAAEIKGEVAADPAKALAAASSAFERVGGTLASIEDAAKGFTGLTKKAEKIDEFLATWQKTGQNLSDTAASIKGVLKSSETDIGPTITNLRQVSEKLNKTLDQPTLDNAKTTIDRLSSASAKLDAALTDIKPVLADLGASVTTMPTTNLGQTVFRVNRISYDIGLLTKALNDGRGGLNANGTIQRLLTHPELYDQFSKMAASANEVLNSAKPAIGSFRIFAEKLARDPSALTRGALQR